MRLQRVRVAESRIEMQIVKWTAEGMVKGVAEYSMTWRIRQLRGVCLYPAESMDKFLSINQGGTADSLLFVLDKAFLLYQGLFYSLRAHFRLVRMKKT